MVIRQTPSSYVTSVRWSVEEDPVMIVSVMLSRDRGSLARGPPCKAAQGATYPVQSGH